MAASPPLQKEAIMNKKHIQLLVSYWLHHSIHQTHLGAITGRRIWVEQK